MEFKDRIKELRKEKELSQTELGNQTGFSLSIINKWEKGKKMPGAPALIILSKFFDESVDYLLGLVD